MIHRQPRTTPWYNYFPGLSPQVLLIKVTKIYFFFREMTILQIARFKNVPIENYIISIQNNPYDAR